jgi:hypothetical protein
MVRLRSNSPLYIQIEPPYFSFVPPFAIQEPSAPVTEPDVESVDEEPQKKAEKKPLLENRVYVSGDQDII